MDKKYDWKTSHIFYIHSLNFFMYIFFATIATIQYKKVTAKIKNIYFNSKGTNPKILPNAVKGTIIPIIINAIEDR